MVRHWGAYVSGQGDLKMDGSDASLWPVALGGLLGMGGTMVGVIGATIRDGAQQRNEKAKRRADKFEELVAAVYEFDHWLDTLRLRNAFGQDVPRTISPFAKVQSISAVYFSQFDELVSELEIAAKYIRRRERGMHRTSNI